MRDGKPSLLLVPFFFVHCGLFCYVHGMFLLVRGKWRGTNPAQQMIEPHGRIVIMHVTIFVAAIPVIAFGEARLAVLALAVMKCGFELGLPQFFFGMDKARENIALASKRE